MNKNARGWLSDATSHLIDEGFNEKRNRAAIGYAIIALVYQVAELTEVLKAASSTPQEVAATSKRIKVRTQTK